MSSTGEATRDVTELIGKFFLVQKLVFAGVLLVASLISWNSVALAFLAPSVDHWCPAANTSDQHNLTDTTTVQPEQKVRDCSCQSPSYDRDVFSLTLTEEVKNTLQRNTSLVVPRGPEILSCALVLYTQSAGVEAWQGT